MNFAQIHPAAVAPTTAVGHNAPSRQTPAQTLWQAALKGVPVEDVDAAPVPRPAPFRLPRRDVVSQLFREQQATAATSAPGSRMGLNDAELPPHSEEDAEVDYPDPSERWLDDLTTRDLDEIGEASSNAIAAVFRRVGFTIVGSVMGVVWAVRRD